VLKALLRARVPPLNDVATGGLGSFALLNMLLAHLMLDAQARAAPAPCPRPLI